MGYITKTSDYWIAPNAITITLNALGEANRIQGSAASGAVIMCFIENIKPASQGGDAQNGDGLLYTNGHEYKTWPISISPTYFNSSTRKYVYCAIPRSTTVGSQAVIVFPSEQLDIYGKAERTTTDPQTGETTTTEVQVGSTDYFYIYLQGIISAVFTNEAGVLCREWEDPIKGDEWGSLDTAGGRDAKINTSDWYHYDLATQVVTFLKPIIMSATSWFRNLIIGSGDTKGTLDGVATSQTSEEYVDSETLVVTPSYINGKFLSKTHDDTAQGNITFAKNIFVKGLLTAYNAVMNNIKSSNYTGDGVADTGFSLTNNYQGQGHSALIVDYIYARMKLVAEALEVKKYEVSAGDQMYSMAANYITRTEYLDGRGEPVGWSEIKVPWLLRRASFLLNKSWTPNFLNVYARKKSVRKGTITAADMSSISKIRCYFPAEDDDREIENWWRVGDLARCQSLNLVSSKREHSDVVRKAGNVFWWRKVVGVSTNSGTVTWKNKTTEEVISASAYDALSAEEKKNYIRNYNGTKDSEISGSGPVTLDDGKKYHYIDLAYNYNSEHPGDGEVYTYSGAAYGSDIPCAGDTAIQFGNDSDPNRMNLMTFELNGLLNADAPCIKIYRGLYTFDLGKSWWGGAARKMMLSPSTGYEFYGPSFKFVQEYGIARVPVDRGDWSDLPLSRDDYPEHTQVRKCNYYDRLTHNGSLWLCVASSLEQGDGAHWVDKNGDYVSDAQYNAMSDADKVLCRRVQNYVTSEPSDSSADWLKQVSKGADGADGQKGDKGDSAESYILEITPQALVNNSSFINPTAIGWAMARIVGTTKETITHGINGYYLAYYHDNGWYAPSSSGINITKAIANTNSTIPFEMRKVKNGQTYNISDSSTYDVLDTKTLIIATDGENGESGYSVAPENIIINQSLSNPSELSNVNQQVNITVRMGATTYTPTSVRVVAITDMLPSGATHQSDTTATKGSSSFTINRIGTYSYTEGSTQKTQYYDRVTFQLSVTFPKDGQSIIVTHYVNLYVNLLGSFKTTIEADVETKIAQKEYAILKPDGTVEKKFNLAEYINSSYQSLSKITEAVTDSEGNYISSSQIKQTAEKITLEVSSQTKNIKGRNFLVGSGFYAYKRNSDKNFSVSPAFYEALKELNPTQTNPVYIGVSVYYFALQDDIDSTTGGTVGRLGISPDWRTSQGITHDLELFAGVDGSFHQTKLFTNMLARAKRVVTFTSVPDKNNYHAAESYYFNQLSPNPKSASRSIVGFAKVEILTANDENLITDWSYAPEESFVSGTNLIEDNLSKPLLLSYGNVQWKEFTITDLANRVKNKVVKLYADIKWVGADDHNFYFHLNSSGNPYTFAMPRQASFKEPSPTHEGYTRYWFRKEMAVIAAENMTDAAELGRVYINGNFSNSNQSSLYVAEVGVMLETFTAGDDVGNALRRTGIDISNGKIVLDAETTVATGTFAAKQVITETDSMMTTVNGGSIVVSSKTTGSYGKFAINSIGEVILQMYDANGKLILNIGGTPNSYQNAFWQLDAEMKYIGNNKPDASECYVNKNTSGVLSYYQLTLGEVTNQDTTITYYYTDGQELTPLSTYNGLISLNHATFKSKDYSLSDLNSNLSSYRISDGYYVPVNNGVFMTKTEDVGGGYKKTTYYATVYHYKDGFRNKIELITVKEEILSPTA